MSQEVSTELATPAKIDIDKVIESYVCNFAVLKAILSKIDKNSTLDDFRRELLEFGFHEEGLEEDLFEGSSLIEMVQQAMEFLKELRKQIYDIAYQTYLPQLESVPGFSDNLGGARQRMELLLFGAYDLDLPKVDEDFECFNNEGAPLITT